MRAIVLAGGKSSRMGENKALLRIDGKCLIEIVIDRLKTVFKHITIVAPELACFTFLQARRVTLIQDLVLEKGALGGIYTGLILSPDEYNFICGCDMPFLNVELLEAMLAKVDGADVLVPVVRGFMEPLHSIYSKRCAVYIRKQLERNDLKITRFFSAVNCRCISEATVAKYDPQLRSFFNINTLEMLRFRPGKRCMGET